MKKSAGFSGTERVKPQLKGNKPASRAKYCASPCPSKRVRLGIEDNLVELQSPGRSEEQVEIFESLGQDEAFHFVALLLGDHVGEGSVAGISATIFGEVVEKLLAHLPILGVTREVIKVVSGFDNFRTEVIRAADDAHRLIIENFRFDIVQIPHLEG